MTTPFAWAWVDDDIFEVKVKGGSSLFKDYLNMNEEIDLSFNWDKV
jgi:hypothetical protein